MEIPRHWRLKKQRYGLVGEVCPHCDHKIFPPRDVCPNCGGVPNVAIAEVAGASDEESIAKTIVNAATVMAVSTRE